MIADDVDALIRSVLARQPDVYERINEKIGGHSTRLAIAAMFTIAVERRFGEDASPSEITDFVSEVRAAYPNAYKVDPILAEGLIRSALGDDSSLSGIDLTDAPATEMFVATAVVDGLNLDKERLDQLVAEAREFALEELGEAAT